MSAATGRPGYHPGDMLRLYIWGYLNQLRSSRHLERACQRDLEALWLLRRLEPDYRTIAAFRHDNPEGIVAASAAFIQFCREAGLISGRVVALPQEHRWHRALGPGPVAYRKRDRLLSRPSRGDRRGSIAGLRRSTGAPAAFTDAIASLGRRKDRLVRPQVVLTERDEKVLVFGEPDAKPMGYAHSPKMPCYNMQSVVDVDSGLIVHHDVANEANDSQLLHPTSIATMHVLEVEELKVLADGGYSNAQAVPGCERDNVEVAIG